MKIPIEETLDALCFVMGVNDWKELYDAVREIDEAVKAYMYGEGDEKIRAWWEARDF